MNRKLSTGVRPKNIEILGFSVKFQDDPKRHSKLFSCIAIPSILNKLVKPPVVNVAVELRVSEQLVVQITLKKTVGSAFQGLDKVELSSPVKGGRAS